MVPLLSVGIIVPIVAGDLTSSFFTLTPSRVLDAVEVGGLRSTGRCLPLRAFENRVYEVELEDERRLVVKFHRPGRWSREAILDEHAFLRDLAEAELPVVAPLDLGKGSTLGEIDGIFYTTFPKIRGRMTDELDTDGRRRIGRTIRRVHAVGAARPGTPKRRAARAGRSSRARGFFASSTGRRWSSASRCARFASSTCRRGSRAAGTTRRFPSPSRRFATTGTGCMSTRRSSRLPRRSVPSPRARARAERRRSPRRRPRSAPVTSGC